MDKQECSSSDDGAAVKGWSEAVDDLVDRGDVDGAVALLESVIAKLEATDGPSPQPSSLPALRLASAIGDLAEIRSAVGLSNAADALRSRAFFLRSAAVTPPPESVSESSSRIQEHEEEDDWEAVADRNEEILLPKREPDDHELSSSHSSEMTTQRRRGRGTFMYNRNSLYSDQTSHDDNDSNSFCDDHDDDRACNQIQISKLKYGTRHVLVLYDLSLSTRTADLEKVFESFRDNGVSVRWVNDTTALAVFRTPSLSLEAHGTLQCPFKVRILSEEDDILSQISARDLEPPYPRPKTSARTAQRLIAQGMGIRLPTDFGSNELRKQEADRKNRIITRQNKRDDAWGSD